MDTPLVLRARNASSQATSQLSNPGNHQLPAAGRSGSARAISPVETLDTYAHLRPDCAEATRTRAALAFTLPGRPGYSSVIARNQRFPSSEDLLPLTVRNPGRPLLTAVTGTQRARAGGKGA